MSGIKDLLFKMADDALIIGHRNSEWTGIGPVLEEDLAFSSMAQDKIGHAFALYTILHESFGEAEPDTLAFKRTEKGIQMLSVSRIADW
jgi:ring-1,2-phenylacetyl-CoA epoxidase subunit PaaC